MGNIYKYKKSILLFNLLIYMLAGVMIGMLVWQFVKSIIISLGFGILLFLHLLDTVKYYVAQDQDYLNRFCKGKVTIITTDWDRMPVNKDKVNDRDTLKLVHFNLAFKPWHFDDIPYQEYFWKYANKTEYIDQINEIKNNFSEEDKIKGDESHKKLVAYAKLDVSCVGDDRI